MTSAPKGELGVFSVDVRSLGRLLLRVLGTPVPGSQMIAAASMPALVLAFYSSIRDHSFNLPPSTVGTDCRHICNMLLASLVICTRQESPLPTLLWHASCCLDCMPISDPAVTMHTVRLKLLGDPLLPPLLGFIFGPGCLQ